MNVKKLQNVNFLVCFAPLPCIDFIYFQFLGKSSFVFLDNPITNIQTGIENSISLLKKRGEFLWHFSLKGYACTMLQMNAN